MVDSAYAVAAGMDIRVSAWRDRALFLALAALARAPEPMGRRLPSSLVPRSSVQATPAPGP
jgi:hypothetical protein